MAHDIFQASDLSKHRTEVLQAARSGRARVRDKDGTSLVMLPERELEVLESYALWSRRHQQLSSLLSSGADLTVEALGDLAWLRVFDPDDIREFMSDLHEALIAGLADRDCAPVDETVTAWRLTARQLEDPLRREVLLGVVSSTDLVEACSPQE